VRIIHPDLNTQQRTTLLHDSYQFGITPMIDIDEMSSKEILDLLQKKGYGHLGCIHEGKPYVMPMHFYLKDSVLYIFTTEGMKSHDMDANPDVCLQVEEIHDPEHWRSVIVTGRAEHLKEQQDIDQAMQFIKA
jgi:uncharacterized protein